MVGPPPVRNQRRVGLLRIAHPDPYPAKALPGWKSANPCLRRNGRLPRDLHALPIRIEQQAVIAASQPVRLQLSLRQRKVAMAAAVFQRDRGAVFLAEQDYGF